MSDKLVLKKQNQTLDKLLLLFAIASSYGIFILICPIGALLRRAKTYSWLAISKSLFKPIVIEALKITFTTALLATIINCVFGLAIAWVLVKLRFPGKELLDIGVDLPFALPTSVGGLTLMIVYSHRGWMGPVCSLLGIKVSFTRLGVLIAMIFVSLPFVIRTIQHVLYNMEKEVEEAAWCLGASEWTTFWWIIFPSLTSSLLTGTTLAFSRAIAEYGSIVLVAGNIPKQDLVISVLIFQRLEQYDHQGAICIALLVMLLSFIMLLTINSIQTWKRSFRK